jgi:hypothetical protein
MVTARSALNDVFDAIEGATYAAMALGDGTRVVRSAVRARVSDAVYGAVDDVVDDAVRARVRAVVYGAVDGAMYNGVRDAMGDILR